MDNCRLDNVYTLGEPFPVPPRKEAVNNSNKKVVLIFTDERNDKTLGNTDALKLRELYNQLYLAAKNRSDRANEIRYYAVYMELYRKHLSVRKDFLEWAVLSFNKYSTRYGTDWLRGGISTLIIALILFLLYCWFFPGIIFGCEYLTHENISFYVVKYIEFSNPVHKINFMNGNLPSWTSAIIDIFARILVGSLIYQTVVAFRRLGKF